MAGKDATTQIAASKNSRLLPAVTCVRSTIFDTIGDSEKPLAIHRRSSLFAKPLPR